jgi:general secretion pathway protein G
MAVRRSVEGEASRFSEDYAGGDAGFSIIEVLVVIVLTGCLASQVCPRVFGVLGHAKQQIAKTDIANISGALDLYKLDVGSYPTSSQGLSALLAKPAGLDAWNGPYTQNKTLMDPWQKPWIYRLGSSEGQHAYDLCSSGGADASGDDKSKAICNS